MKAKWLLAGLCCISSSVFASWQLNNEESKLSFISIKATDVAEVHHFGQLSGSISDAGDAVLEIDLNSVATSIDIRNERMKKELFQTGQFPKATYSVKLDPELLKKVTPGASIITSIDGSLELHDVKKEVKAEVVINRVSDKQVVVSTLQPLVINAADFALKDGVMKLKDIAKLPSISISVPVTFNLTFDAK
ncbi:YceI family protein [Hahella sp. KA22]|uniref:YceI family protein n=1 Tax=Hahella sp. KA22 TaxID=1628392 RepID=UPI000FDEC40A|nr:YceI family protein [Hahella sp. KA22]AZZ89863.1 YceI family protein [Hahella sp. KA22]QAY53232.1 YceI family protein [Hahella sp. KA22]